MFGPVRGTVSQIQKSASYPSNFTSGRVGDPGTGIPIGYAQSASFTNGFGDVCSGGSAGLGTVLRTIDGSYYGWPQCQKNYVVKLSPMTGYPESGTTLLSVEPTKATDSLIVKVHDQNGQVVPNVNVKLELSVDTESGGHHHPSSDRPVGTLSSGTMTGETITGNTGANGLAFSFKAPAPAGDHHITASCTDGENCKPEGPDTVWVGYKGLLPLGSNAVYRLIPNATKDAGHPDNHYLTLIAASRLSVFAALYHAKYPDLSVLQLNDAGLERGGVFDIGHNWHSPHWEHCHGTVIDIRANGAEGALDIISPDDPMIMKFRILAAVVGADAKWEVPKKKDPSTATFVDQWDVRHFHTRLMGQEGLQCP